MRKIAFIAIVAAGAFQAMTTMASADWAIAVGQEGHSGYAYGTAYNYDNTDDAHSKALSNCRSEGRNCKVVADGAGACAAIAFGKGDNAYGWSAGDTKREAERASVKECNKYSDGSCEVRSSFCDQ
jgi:hypothetical protein